MKILVSIFLIFCSAQALASPACFDFFVVVNDPLAFEQREAAYTPRDLTSGEVSHLVSIAKDTLGERDVEESNVFHVMLHAKRKYEAELQSQSLFHGQRVSSAVRSMRRRRGRFDEHLVSNDPIAAAEVYRPLWEAYHISMSELLRYGRTKNTEARDQALIDTAQRTLEGLVASPYLSSVRQEYRRIYGEGLIFRVRRALGGSPSRSAPSVSEILAVYDTIFAISRSEFAYVNYHMNRLSSIADSVIQRATSPTEDAAAQTEVSDANKMKGYIETIRNRLSSDLLASRFHVDIISQQDMNSRSSREELFSLRPQSLVMWLKHVVDLERRRSRRLIVRASIQELFIRLTNGLPDVRVSVVGYDIDLRRDIRRLIMLDYNAYVMERHIESLESVIMADVEDQPAAFLVAVARGTQETTVQFLETFARLSPDKAVWDGLKDHFAKDDSTVAKELMRQMLEAEEKIASLGFLSRTYMATRLDMYIGLGIRSSPLVGAYAFSGAAREAVNAWIIEQYVWVMSVGGAILEWAKPEWLLNLFQ